MYADYKSASHSFVLYSIPPIRPTIIDKRRYQFLHGKLISLANEEFRT